MTFRLRAAHRDDLEPLYEMAKLTGGGFTIKNPNAKSTCGCGSSFNV